MEAIAPLVLIGLIGFLGAPALILVMLLIISFILIVALGLPLDLKNFLLSLIVATGLPLSAYLAGSMLEAYAFKKSEYLSFLSLLLASCWYLSSGLYLNIFDSLVVLTQGMSFINISAGVLKFCNCIFQTAALAALATMLIFWLIELPLLVFNAGLKARVDFNFAALRQIGIIFILFFAAVYLQDFFTYNFSKLNV